MPGRPADAGPLLSPRRVGDLNRSRILQTLVDQGPLSRADLARAANVTRATIGNIVQSLIDAGVLEEHSTRSGQVGKPPRMLWFAPGAALSLVAALEGSKVEAAVVDASGSVLARQVSVYPKGALTEASVRTTVLVALAAASGQVPDAELTGVGIAVPAMCDASTGEVVASSVLPSLQGSWLREALQSAYDVPVVIDTDSRAQALSEKWFGLGRGAGSFASVEIGAGIGAGVVQNGTVFRADHGIGGEFGHTIVDRAGLRCRCERRGCWETIASTEWLRKEARRRGLGTAMTPAKLTDRRLMADYADNIAVGLANLMHIYHPVRFILHGEVLDGGEPLRAAIEKATRDRVVPLTRDDVDVVFSELGRDATLLGAAALVLSERFQLAI